VALAARDPDAARREIRVHLEDFARDLDATVRGMRQRGGPDGTVYRRPEVRDGLLATYREAFRSGIDGAVEDVLLGKISWRFDLAEVSMPLR